MTVEILNYDIAVFEQRLNDYRLGVNHMFKSFMSRAPVIEQVIPTFWKLNGYIVFNGWCV